jgi:hypothetical protein
MHELVSSHDAATPLEKLTEISTGEPYKHSAVTGNSAWPSSTSSFKLKVTLV